MGGMWVTTREWVGVRRQEYQDWRYWCGQSCAGPLWFYTITKHYWVRLCLLWKIVKEAKFHSGLMWTELTHTARAQSENNKRWVRHRTIAMAPLAFIRRLLEESVPYALEAFVGYGVNCISLPHSRHSTTGGARVVCDQVSVCHSNGNVHSWLYIYTPQWTELKCLKCCPKFNAL